MAKPQLYSAMQDLVQTLKDRANLGQDTCIDRVLVLDITKRTIIYSENVPDPAALAHTAWAMWQNATGMVAPTDLDPTDQVVEIRSGLHQTILFSDSNYLSLASFHRDV